MENHYAETTRIELEKALAEKPNEFKTAVESLIENSEKLVAESKKARIDMDQIIKEAEIVAGNCLDMDQIIKNLHIWLNSINENFPVGNAHFASYQKIKTTLSKYVVSPQAIKTGVIRNARK